MNVATIPLSIDGEQLKNCRDWIAALRSGKYSQCQSYLENNGKFCCLGVACKEAGVPHDESTFDFGNDVKLSKYPDPAFFEKRYGFVPFTKIACSPREDASPWPSYDLAELNDVLKFNFNQIADIIESCINGEAKEYEV